MTNKDAAGTLPGNAPQLAALADPVYATVDAGVFDDLGNRFSEAGGKTAVATNKVRVVVAEVDGASADAFVDYMNGFTAAGMSVADALTDAASDLYNAGGTVQGWKGCSATSSPR
ncbi:hypothetical protein [Actinophytocola glycyrrhizae]|uniref:Uncharacterized protein n=1 Tax=Actinophytocola glycyrrhizae TaxID=2044873 RepID=A0ABV9S6U8_9PSEU